MDRQLLERMIGAGVLIVALVLIVPAILDGQREGDPGTGTVVESGSGISSELVEPTRTHTMRLDQQPEAPPVAREKTDMIVAPESVKSQADADELPAATLPPQVSKPDPKPAAKDAKPVTVIEEKDVPKVAEAPKSTKLATADQSSKQSRQQVPSSGWAVQLGSFSDKKNAERLATAVSKNGFSTYLMPSQQSGKLLYRVRVGPRDSRAQASELAERLAKAGYKGQVTQQSPDS